MSFTSCLEGTRWSDVHTATACAFLAGTAMFTADFALALRLQTEGSGGAAVAAVIICATLPLVLLAPAAGRMADRFDSRILMAASGALQTASILAMAFTSDLLGLLGLVVLNATGTAVLQPAVGALTPLMATRADLPRALAFTSTGTLLGAAAGPAAAGLVVGAHGAGAALLGAAACAALRSLLCLDIRTRRGGIRREAEVRTARVSWSLRSDKLLLVMALGLGAVLTALCAVNVLSVFLIRETYGATESAYGLVRASWTVAMIAGAWIAAAIVRRMARDSQLAWLHFISLAGVGLTVLAQGLPWSTVLIVAALNLFGGLFNAGQNAALQNAVARRVAESLRGRANAAVGACVNAGQLLGFLLGGALSTLLDVPAAFMLVGGFALAIVLVCAPVVLRVLRNEDSVGVEADLGGPHRRPDALART